MTEKSYKDYVFPEGEKKREIFKRALARQMETGKPYAALAARLLDPTRHHAALEDPDSTLRRVSHIASNGQNILLSYAFVKANVDHLGPDERVSALLNMYETGSPYQGLSPFSHLKND